MAVDGSEFVDELLVVVGLLDGDGVHDDGECSARLADDVGSDCSGTGGGGGGGRMEPSWEDAVCGDK